MAVSVARWLVIDDVARGMSIDTQLTFSPARCSVACSSAVGSGLLTVAFCSGFHAFPDAWLMNAS